MRDNALHYFYEAARAGSMRGASQRLGVAVSSVSRQIGQLEAEIGLPLIERGSRAIKLTPAGELAFEFQRNRLAELEVLANQLQELREIKRGRVDLAIGEGFLGTAMTEVLDRFQRGNEGIVIAARSGTSAEIIRMVLEDEAHIGMILHTSSEPKIRTRAEVRQPLMALCAPRHPAAALDGLSLAMLAQFDLCLPPATFRIRSALNHAQKRSNIWLEPKVVTTSIPMMRDMARAGRMITVLPRIAAQAELDSGQLVARPILDDEMDQSSISLIHRMERRLDGAPARLLGILERKLKSWA